MSTFSSIGLVNIIKESHWPCYLWVVNYIYKRVVIDTMGAGFSLNLDIAAALLSTSEFLPMVDYAVCSQDFYIISVITDEFSLSQRSV